MIAHRDALVQIKESMDSFCNGKGVKVDILNVVHNADIVPRLLGNNLGNNLLKMILKLFVRRNILSDIVASRNRSAEQFLPFGTFLILREVSGAYKAITIASENLEESPFWKCEITESMRFISDHLMDSGYIPTLAMIRQSPYSPTMVSLGGPTSSIETKYNETLKSQDTILLDPLTSDIRPKKHSL